MGFNGVVKRNTKLFRRSKDLVVSGNNRNVSFYPIRLPSSQKVGFNVLRLSGDTLYAFRDKGKHNLLSQEISIILTQQRAIVSKSTCSQFQRKLVFLNIISYHDSQWVFRLLSHN